MEISKKLFQGTTTILSGLQTRFFFPNEKKKVIHAFSTKNPQKKC